MSDYLWDKSGEADPEVERLEQLLGGLRHRHDALELPPVAATRPVSGAARFFRPAALVAAALALVALAGLLIALRGPSAGEPVAASMREPSRTGEEQNATASEERNETASEERSETANVVAPHAGNVEAIDPQAIRRHTPGQVEMVEPRQTSPGVRVRAHRAGGAARRVKTDAQRSGLAEVAARDASQTDVGNTETDPSEAKQQLLYALRLASVKLGDARRLAQGDEVP